MLSPSDGRMEVKPVVLKFQLSGSESMVLRSPRALSDRLLLNTWLSMTVKLLLCALRRTAMFSFLAGALMGAVMRRRFPSLSTCTSCGNRGRDRHIRARR